MNQHLSSMLEHLSLSSLRRKNTENAQTSSSSDKHNNAASQKHEDIEDVESMSSKTKNIFKDLISDNGATNIFHNLNFIKCSSIPNNSTTTLVSSSSSSNGMCRTKEQQQKNLNGDDNNNLHKANLLHPTANETNSVENHIKRNSISGKTPNGNGDLDIKRELSPPPNRIQRKSSHDIRMLRNNHMQDASDDVGKPGNVVKPLKIKNIITQNETCDTLHCRAMDVSILNN